MNSVKTVVVIFAAAALTAGCGQKGEEQTSLPPEQILSGNAILAPYQPVMEARSVGPGDIAIQPMVLTPEPTLDLKSSSSSEKPSDRDIQQALKNAGVYSGAIDGKLGPRSKKAIKLFQEQNGLSADGKVGPRTWKKLSGYLHAAPPVSDETIEISN